jgi:hypothetical protein
MPRSIPRAVALPVLLIALSACNRKPADVEHAVAEARQEARAIGAKLAALPAQCAIGSSAGASGSWIAAQQAVPASTSGAAPAFVFTFKEPIRTQAFRVALNARALHNLDKVESRDAQGNWSMAWAGGQADAPAGCDVVKMAQPFVSGRRDVVALRLIFRPGDRMLIADMSVLQAD